MTAVSFPAALKPRNEHCIKPGATHSVRSRFIAHLGEAGVKTVFHYVPLHSSPMGQSFGERHLPVTDDISDRLVRLPLFPSLDNAMVDRVVAAVQSF